MIHTFRSKVESDPQNFLGGGVGDWGCDNLVTFFCGREVQGKRHAVTKGLKRSVTERGFGYEVRR